MMHPSSGAFPPTVSDQRACCVETYHDPVVCEGAGDDIIHTQYVIGGEWGRVGKKGREWGGSGEERESGGEWGRKGESGG